MAHHGVYMYPYNQEVSLGNFNMPFNNAPLVLHRGANNTVSFTVHNADGKYTLLKDNQYLIFSIYDARNDTRIFENVLDKVLPSWLSESGQARQSLGNKQKVYYGCLVPAGVIQDLSPGSKYRWSITKVTMDGTLIEPTEYLYTGLDYEASAELIIKNTAAPTFTPSYEISATADASWTPIKNELQQPIHKGIKGEYALMHSSCIKAEAQYGLVDGLSTIAFYFDDFIGRVQLQACLSNDIPTESNRWFVVKLGGCEYIEPQKGELGALIPMNGIHAFNFKGQFMWLRVVVALGPTIRHVRPDIIEKEYKPLLHIPKILIRR